MKRYRQSAVDSHLSQPPASPVCWLVWWPGEAPSESSERVTVRAQTAFSAYQLAYPQLIQRLPPGISPTYSGVGCKQVEPGDCAEPEPEPKPPRPRRSKAKPIKAKPRKPRKQ